jgi:hypothetical protein
LKGFNSSTKLFAMAIVNNHANGLHNFRWCDDVEVGLIDILLMNNGGTRGINVTRDGDYGRS